MNNFDLHLFILLGIQRFISVPRKRLSAYFYLVFSYYFWCEIPFGPVFALWKLESKSMKT
ncbi:hypothetical protein [Paraglaciecola sp.]|uniref:hypothetical protein n=1 Tax=Paraglaciecola sp. TaxID=1920173 RepID=UPI00329769A1